MVRKCILLIAILLAAVVRLSAEEQTLKDRFGDKFLVGCAVNQWQSSGYEKGSVELIKKHYNSIVAENVMKSAVIHPEENRYDWTQADKFVQFGVDMALTVSALVLCGPQGQSCEQVSTQKTHEGPHLHDNAPLPRTREGLGCG
jgi:GH35 family endo-1,4-beta-xylanase